MLASSNDNDERSADRSDGPSGASAPLATAAPEKGSPEMSNIRAARPEAARPPARRKADGVQEGSASSERTTAGSRPEEQRYRSSLQVLNEPVREEEAAAAGADWLLRQIVESAESKLMRRRQSELMRQGGSSNGLQHGRGPSLEGVARGNKVAQRDDSRKSPPEENSKCAPEFEVDEGASEHGGLECDETAGAVLDDDDDEEHGGPTPTNNLIRALIHKDRRALAGRRPRKMIREAEKKAQWAQASGAYRESESVTGTSQQPSASWCHSATRGSVNKAGAGVGVDERQRPEAAERADGSAGDAPETEQELKGLEASNKETRRRSASSRAAFDLSTIISKCHTLQLAESTPYQLAKRALRSVSPRRPSTGQAPEGSERERRLGGADALAGPQSKRRHSTYLFPAMLAHKPSSIDADSSDSSNTDDQITLDQRPREERRSAEQQASRAGEPANLRAEDDDWYDDRNDRRLAVSEFLKQSAAASRGLNSRKLRNSASSPSALSTPTNDNAPACSGPCCSGGGGPPLAEAAGAAPAAAAGSRPRDDAHRDECPAGGFRKASDGAMADRYWLEEAGQPAGRYAGKPAIKRQSLMNVLQASAGIAGRRLVHPRALFSGPQSGARAQARQARNSVESIGAHSVASLEASGQAYDPLIPESGFKIVVMGTSGSGKTSIVRRFMYNSFSSRHNPTVEDTYFIEFPYMKNIINISITDTSGTYQFPAMRKLAINSGDAFILVYSVDNPRSLEELEQLRLSILEERELACSEAASSLASSESLASAPGAGGLSGSASALSCGQLWPDGQQQPAPDTAPLDTGSGSSPSRHWSLASILAHAGQARAAAGAHLAAGSGHCAAKGSITGSSVSGGSSASSCCSSTDNSRRSSVSAAEAALRTRRTRRPPMVIVANKHDLPADRHLVNSDEVEAQAVIDWNNGFVRASAALDMNIEDIFQQVLTQARQPPTLAEAIVSKRRKSLPPKFSIAR